MVEKYTAVRINDDQAGHVHQRGEHDHQRGDAQFVQHRPSPVQRPMGRRESAQSGRPEQTGGGGEGCLKFRRRFRQDSIRVLADLPDAAGHDELAGAGGAGA
ncbi:MAG: hypothetical protein ABWY94_06510, partial [Pseudoxanthomonas sp.]